MDVLRTALLDDDLDAARDAAREAARAGRAEALLDEARWDPESGTFALAPPAWPDERALRPARQRAALLLLHALPVDRARAHTAGVTTLAVDASLGDARSAPTAPMDLAGLARFTRLERLRLGPLDVVERWPSLAGLGALRELEAQQLRAERTTLPVDAPHLETLVVQGAERLHLDPFTARHLTHLHVRAKDVTGLAALDDAPALQEIGLDVAWTDLRRFDFVARAPALRVLRVPQRGPTGVRALANHPALTLCALHGAAVGEDLDAFDALPALRHLNLLWYGGGDLRPLGHGLPQLEELVLRGSRLRSLDGLGPCPKLARVDLSHSRVRDLRALRDHPRLEELLLEGTPIRDLRSLGAPPKLRRLVVRGTRLERDKVAEPLLAAAQPPLSRPPRPKDVRPRPTVRRGALGRRVARLKRLLFTRDFDQIDHAVALAEALGDPEVFDALLEGTERGPGPGIRCGERTLPLPFGRVPTAPLRASDTIVPNGLFAHGDIIAPWRQHALRALLAAAPAGTPAAALRGSLETLRVDGRSTSKRCTAVDIAPLAAFEKLRVLHVRDAAPLRGDEALPRFLRLEELDIRSSERASPDAPLVPGPALRAVRIDAEQPHEVLGDGAGWEKVELLDLAEVRLDAPAALGALRGAQAIALRHLRGFGPEALEALSSLPALETLALHHRTPLDLGALAGAASLRRLALGGRLDPAQLPTLPKLEELEVGHLRDVSALREMQGLRRLAVRWAHEGLDVAGLADHPTLEEVALPSWQLRYLQNVEALAGRLRTMRG
ncbi:MAG TPA: hypothetical protein RMH85_31390 [Polyangiaceae bacterium LLY-WYZ-15_(1-7)]|nr:hypothetical protein [Sandaracinus sp.]HJL01522.1 hypothetical protein [Polyangiaceae bacterium LLY-WYZ-15_(1-7)]HJL13028.1 hypothetical protein [Polyangiaceae bacterium LLY-WYZ-15_(1-7)]HJL38586.1 hypothetical protein [Polyangiaceae bacterium LLY-WYZ-15_(1-7)]